jgi:uncharacterized membrane protein required for colicin V production
MRKYFSEVVIARGHFYCGRRISVAVGLVDIAAAAGFAASACGGFHMVSCFSRSAIIVASAAAISFLATVSGSFVHGVPDPQRRIAQPLIFFFYI